MRAPSRAAFWVISTLRKNIPDSAMPANTSISSGVTIASSTSCEPFSECRLFMASSGLHFGAHPRLGVECECGPERAVNQRHNGADDHELVGVIDRHLHTVQRHAAA